MMDQNYVIVHCPKGHELQAAREHLSATLSCPVCGIEFVPAAVPPSHPATDQNVAANTRPELLSRPVTYPAVTTLKLWLWGMLVAFIVGSGLVRMILAKLGVIDPQAAAASPQTPGAWMMLLGCSVIIVFVVACILQFVWIYRIHDDAERAKGYKSVNSILAVLLSIVPFVNWVWTAWTMRKLSRFVRSDSEAEAASGEGAIAKSESSTRVCLIFAWVLFLLVTIGIGYSYQMSMAAKVVATVDGKFDRSVFNAELAKHQASEWVNVLLMVLFVVSMWVYWRAVRSLEAALYPFLGAPPK